jgi:hypothetical protein
MVRVYPQDYRENEERRLCIVGCPTCRVYTWALGLARSCRRIWGVYGHGDLMWSQVANWKTSRLSPIFCPRLSPCFSDRGLPRWTLVISSFFDDNGKESDRSLMRDLNVSCGWGTVFRGNRNYSIRTPLCRWSILESTLARRGDCHALLSCESVFGGFYSLLLHWALACPS